VLNKEIVGFSVGDALYGIKAEDIYQIIGGDCAVTYLPFAKDYISGVISFETDILPVVSASKFFNPQGQKQTIGKSIIILQKLDEKLALSVEGEIEFIGQDQLPGSLRMIKWEDFQR
jgi:chemotaxis signal transduction protein